MKRSSAVHILGIPFLPLRRAEATDALIGFCEGGRAARVFTPNPELLLCAKDDSEFAALLSSADLLLPDGVGILLAARLRGARLPERLTGIDTAEALLVAAAERGFSVFLLGGRRGVAEEAARALQARFPALRIAGTHHGYFDKARSSAENLAVCSQICECAPTILFVCFGAPAQEKWIAENADAIPSLRLCMGLGGALDVWSGRLRRAPRLFRACGLEWLWRVLCDVKRLPRLFAIPRFLIEVLR